MFAAAAMSQAQSCPILSPGNGQFHGSGSWSSWKLTFGFFFPRWISHWISCLSWPTEHQGLFQGVRRGPGAELRGTDLWPPWALAMGLPLLQVALQKNPNSLCKKIPTVSCMSTGMIQDLYTGQQSHPCTAQSLPWGATCILGCSTLWGLGEEGDLPRVLTCLCFLLPLVELLSEGCFWASRACFSEALFFSALAPSASL